ncbi:MAG: hypothetical protein RLP02_28445 [Coleofasciculus sp. C2-GNP5-27]
MQQSKHNFLHPRARYRGAVKPEHLVLNANLQEFAQRVSYICNLQTAGKLSPDQAFEQIESLWYKLQHCQAQLSTNELENLRGQGL